MLSPDDKAFINDAVSRASPPELEQHLEKLRAYHQREHEGRTILAEHVFGMRSDSLKASVSYGQATLRGLAVANGGGVLLIVAIVGHLLTREQCGVSAVTRAVDFPVFLYISGLVAALLSAFLGYLNFQMVFDSWKDPVAMSNWIRDHSSDLGSASETNKHAIWTMVLALAFGVLSGALFASGSISAVGAFGRLPC